MLEDRIRALNKKTFQGILESELLEETAYLMELRVLSC